MLFAHFLFRPVFMETLAMTKARFPKVFCRALSILLLLSTLFTSSSQTQTPMIRPANLQCEFLINPLGIDNAHPYLSWIVESTQRGERQTAYRILVASTTERLASNTGDLWDTGKIATDMTSLVAYQGQPLVSHKACFWKVMAWGKDGKPGEWSEPAFWSMGILTPREWRSDWIGYDAPRRNEGATPFARAQWIWFKEDKPGDVSPCRRYFGRVFELSSNAEIESADLAATADGAFRLFLNSREVASSPGGVDSWKSPRRLDVSSILTSGKNIVFAEADNARQGHAGFLFWLRLKFKNGKTETIVSDQSWLSSDVAHEEWKTNGAREGEGGRPNVLGNFGLSPWGLLDGKGLVLPPPRYVQTNFPIGKSVVRAVLYASALGLCDLYLNGHQVSQEYFTPGWTDYAKRVYYRTYDVTRLVKDGTNSLGAILADGWYSGYLGWGAVRDHYGSKTRLKVQLHIEYKDGSEEEIGSGPRWKAWTGPIREADFLMGETYDARLVEPGRFTAGTGGIQGDPVDVGAEVQPVLQSHPAPPVRAFAELIPLSVTEAKQGVYVFDLGQNCAGVARLKIKGREGQKVTLRFAERLNPDGTIYTENLRGARATDTYICRGDAEEVWAPRFTFHGFQYVEVIGLSAKPDRATVTGLALSSDTPIAGEFECSDTMLNTLHRNVLGTQRSNFIDIPTDCPQRDERLGWTGDAEVYIRAACMNADVQAFFHKWIVDLTDAQRNDGQFPMVAPLKVAGDDGGPAWADAGVICPWTIYEVYGDEPILAQHYEAMKRFVEFCRQRSTADLLPPVQFHCFGDWLNIDAETPKEIIYTAYFARVAQLLAQAAEVLGKSNEALTYRDLHASVRASFNRAFVSSNGEVKSGTQTAYVLALGFDLLDEVQSKRAFAHLLSDIERRGWHLSTGFIGTKDLMLVLSRFGRNDVAYRLLLNTTFPSWGFTIQNGATSIWERWDGWTPDRGFQNPEMNSFAHYSFGAVYQWMVENIGGIRSDGPGFRKLIIAPEPGGNLSSARVAYRSIHGLIRTEWQMKDGGFVLAIDIPTNTTARVLLPHMQGSALESGRPAGEQKDVRYVGTSERGKETFEVGSGHYQFSYRYKN